MKKIGSRTLDVLNHAILLIKKLFNKFLGVLSTPSSVSDYVIFAMPIEVAKTSVKASNIITLDFWDTPVDKNKYLEINYEAVKRGVNVKIVFIIDNLTLETETLLNGMVKNGIDVLLVDKNKVPDELKVAFVISDDHLVSITEYKPDTLLRESLITEQSEEVIRVLSKFEKLSRLAKKYSPDVTSAG